MRPYWIKVERQPSPTFLNLGVGITASSEEEARAIFADAFGSDVPVVSVAPIEDMRDIDQGHVRNNMGNWFQRGIWFPKGHETRANRQAQE